MSGEVGGIAGEVNGEGVGPKGISDGEALGTKEKEESGTGANWIGEGLLRLIGFEGKLKEDNNTLFSGFASRIRAVSLTKALCGGSIR